MNQSEINILRDVVRHQPFYGRYCPAFGARDRQAAERLEVLGLATIIELEPLYDCNRYIVVAPGCERDAS
ncbi:MAG TPA: hypothetical protein VFM97_00320 [Gammaproteobacteria bacterium]|nr:hypothetical protein [Gammaproteobacteria bacterium]